MNYFLNVNEKLGQSVKNKLSFIDENIDFILEELFAVFELWRKYLSWVLQALWRWTSWLACCGVFWRRFVEYQLSCWDFQELYHIHQWRRICTKLRWEPYLLKVDDFVSGQVKETTWSSDDDMRVFGWIFELSDVVLERYTSEIGAISKLRFFEVASWISLKEEPSLLKSLKIWWANSLVWHVTTHWWGSYWSPYGAIWFKIEMTKTAVFPIPDLAWQRISCPWRAWGMVLTCTSLGCSNPHSRIALLS